MEKKIELTVEEFRQIIAETVTSTLESVNERAKPKEKERNYFTRNEVMESLKIRPMEFAELSRKEGFPGKFIGKSWLIPKQEFNEWIAKNQIRMF